MISVGHKSIRIATEPLESSLPPEMFAPDGDQGAQNALRAFRIVEGIIRDRCGVNALTARFAMLQSFARLNDEPGSDKGSSSVDLDVPEFVRQYAIALCPAWYGEYVAQLTDNQVEILLKHALYAHETWGHDEGIGGLVRSVLEESAHAPVQISVVPLEGEVRAIAPESLSLLGSRNNFSSLGRDFAIGRSLVSRPERYEVRVGPLDPGILESFRKGGWAEGVQPSWKLERLVEFAEPFYLHSRIRFLLESSTSGFVLARGLLGTGTLGSFS